MAFDNMRLSSPFRAEGEVTYERRASRALRLRFGDAEFFTAHANGLPVGEAHSIGTKAERDADFVLFSDLVALNRTD